MPADDGLQEPRGGDIGLGLVLLVFRGMELGNIGPYRLQLVFKNRRYIVDKRGIEIPVYGYNERYILASIAPGESRRRQSWRSFAIRSENRRPRSDCRPCHGPGDGRPGHWPARSRGRYFRIERIRVNWCSWSLRKNPSAMPRFSRTSNCIRVAAAAASFALNSGVPRVPSSPRVRSTTPVFLPCRFSISSVPEQPSSTSSGCTAIARISNFIRKIFVFPSENTAFHHIGTLLRNRPCKSISSSQRAVPGQRAGIWLFALCAVVSQVLFCI